jgi:ADP-heptose:LPS heptosyltransferase
VFIKLIEMGSNVLAVPAFAEAARLVGRENLFIIVFRRNRPILEVLPHFPLQNVIEVEDESLGRFALSLLRALRRVRRERIDTAIDLEGLTRASALIAYLTGARNRVGYYNFTNEGPFRGRLFTHEVLYGFHRHVSEMFLALVRALGAPPGQTPLLKERVALDTADFARFVPTEDDTRRARAMLGELGGDAGRRRIVILNPNCNDSLPLRRWPDDRFVELGRRLIAEADAAAVVTGLQSERARAGAIAAAIAAPGRVISLAGRTTLRDVLALYCLSDVLVSNDSGPCHFASLTPIRVVALFGPETPRLYGPLGPRVTVLTAGLACSPCVSVLNHRFSPCTDNRCMQAISVDEVMKATVAAMAQSGAQGRA